MDEQKNVDALLARPGQELERIETRDDLVKFIALLSEGIEAKAFEEQGLIDYIDGIYGVVDGLDGLAKNTGIPNPDPPDWKLVGRILLYGFYHS